MRALAATPGVEAPSASNYVSRIIGRLAADPEHQVVKHGHRSLSAHELRRQICGAVEGLQRLGVTPDGTVAALTEPNDPQMLVIRYAANLIGARVVYIRSVNPRTEEIGLSQAERARILDETSADVLFVDRANLGDALALPGQGDRAVPLCGFDLEGEVEHLAPADELPAGIPTAIAPEQIAAIVYTTGTTGVPKGVRLSFGAWESMVRGFARSQRRPTTFLAVTPISQAVSTMVDACLMAGGAVVLHPGFDADAVLDAIAGDGVAAAYMAMPHLYALLDNPRTESTDVSGISCLIYSGTPASPRRMEHASRVFGNALIQSYGTTEAGPIAVLLPMAHRSADLRGTVGRPLPGVRIRIRDPQTRDDLAVGAVGEVWVCSPTTMSGYLAEQDGDPVFARDGWLRTGDLGVLDPRGYLRLLGRAGDVIKCRGIKIFPAILEEALGSHPDVIDAHVFGLRGEDAIEKVHAAVAVRPRAATTCTDLGRHVAQQLTPLHVPDVVTVWTSLPFTANGKPDRRRLAAWVESESERILRVERLSHADISLSDAEALT